MSTPLSDLLTRLAATMNAEFEALRQRDIDALAGALEEKKVLLDQLSAVEASVLDTDPALREQLAACRQANRRVGGALQLHQQLTAELVNSLSGGGGRDPVYAANGQVQWHSSAGPVATA